MKLLHVITIKILLLTLFSLVIIQTGFSQSKLWGLTSSGGDGFGTLFSIATGGNSIINQHNLNGTPGSNPQYLNLIQASDGKLYGTTYSGGSAGGGVLFQYDPSTNVYIKKVDFTPSLGYNPRGSLIQAGDGKLYGMTTLGGANNGGVIFQYDPLSDTYIKKVDLTATNGIYPFGSLLQAGDGSLYGMTNAGGANGCGVIFKYNPLLSTYTKRIDLSTTNGCNPYGSLIQASNGKLYGMTSNGGATQEGVIFEYDPITNTYLRKISLSATNGNYPWGSLMQAGNGKLYGMTNTGGIYNGGVIFQYDPATNNYTKLKDLSGAAGESPYGSLIQANDGNLYGMTYRGGSLGIGVIFQYNLNSSAYTIKVNFASGTGYRAYGTLMQASDGNLYGTTFSGGAKDVGVIFQYNLNTNTYTKKVDFSAAPEGDAPNGSLVRASDGKFYGMTRYGGANNSGVIFQYDTTANTYIKKLDLDSANGNYPRGTMVQASNGKLYGMTTFGGSKDAGTIFQYDPASSTYTKKTDLTTANGSNPSGSLIQASNGKLYGMTYNGGSKDGGVIFQYDPVTNTYTKRTDLDSANGGNPYGALLEASNGKLYGMTTLGGANDYGVIFQFDPGTNVYTKKIDLSKTNGATGYGSLIEASNGKLYGMTYSGGANDAGVIFEYDIATNTYTRKIDLASSTGSGPYGSLMKASDGMLYGTTSAGGANGVGVIFQYNLNTNSYTKILDFANTNGSTPLGNLVEIVCPLTSQADPISGESSLCAGDSKTYSINPVTGATGYYWSVPSGATINSGQNSTSISITFGSASGNVSVSPINGCGVGPTTSLVVTVSPKPIVGIIASPSSTICSGSSVTLTGTGGTTYSWSGGITNGLAFVPATTTTYSVTTTTNGCTSASSITITVNSKPTVGASASPSSSICSGSSVTLIGTGASTYVWSNGVINGTPFSPNTTATYTVTGTSANGCTNTATQTITVTTIQPPAITATPSSTICAGSSVTLNATGATSYTWSGGVTPGVPFTPASTATYTVTGTTNGCTATASLTVTVNPLPAVEIIASPSSTVCIGSSVTLNGTGANSYSWSGGITNGTPFTPSATTTYTVTGTSAGGCSSTASITITVNPLPTVGFSASPANTVCSGTSVTLTGTGATSYSWSGGVTNGVSFIPSSTTTYTVTGTSNGCSNTAVAAITVNPIPIAGIIASPSTVVCLGSSVTLNGTGGITYSWSSGIANGIAFVPNSTATYTLTATTNGCSDVSTITITVNPRPTVGVTTSPSSTICSGSSVTLSGSGAATYSWTNGIINASPFSPNSTATYTVTGTSANGCTNTATQTVTVTTIQPPAITATPSSTICAGSSVTLNATGATSYTWSGGVTPGVPFTPSSTATYTVTGTTNGCTATASLTVTVNPAPAVGIVASPSSTICIGSSVTLIGTGANSYSWSGGITNGTPFAPGAVTTYTVTGTGSNGCTATQTITLYPVPLIDINATSTSVCSGSSVTLTGTGAASYSWSGSITNAQSFTPNATTTYTVTGTASNGCTGTKTILITVNSNPVVGSNVSPSAVVCSGSSITLNGTGANSYSWTGGVTDGISFTPLSTTTYTVTGTNVYGCTGTDTITVKVNTTLSTPLPISGKDTVCSGTTNSYSVPEIANASSYTWTLPSGWTGTSSTNSINATSSTTSGIISVTANNACGSSSPQTLAVKVNATPDVAVAGSQSSNPCPGVSILLYGTGADSSYSWTGGIIDSVAFSLPATTTFTVTGTNKNGCTGTFTLTIPVNDPPNVSALATPATSICLGSSVKLNGTGAQTYSWSGGITNGVDFTPSSTATYTVTGTDIYGCTNTGTITVTVNTTTAITGPISGNTSVCSGSTNTYSVNPVAGAFSYTWTIPSGWSGTSTSNSINTISTSTGVISVAANNGCGSSTPQTLNVTVNTIPSVQATILPAKTVCAGTSVTLTGTGATSYTWTGGVINGLAFQPSSTATYTVTGTDANQCTSKDTITITVIPVPSTGITIAPASTVCFGSTVTLTGTGANSYNWSGGISNGTAFIPATSTTYTVTGTTLGCSSTNTVTITVNPLPSVAASASPSTSVCFGTPVTLSGVGNAASYSWSGGLLNGIAFQPFSTTTYTVTGTSATGCSKTDTITITAKPLPAVGATASPSATLCSGASVTLNGTGATSYSWSGGITNGTSFVPSTTTTYTVTGTSSGCSSTETITITVNSIPTVGFNVSPSTTICSGTPVIMYGSGATSYSWLGGVINGTAFNPATTSTYTVTGTTNGCSGTATATITVNPKPIIGINTFPSSTICIGSSVTLSGTGSATFNWTGGITDGVPFQPAATNTYTVTGIDINQCFNKDTVTITVNPVPLTDITVAPANAICAGATVTLTATGASSYSWTGGVVNGIAFNPVATATYTVTGTTLGCSSTKTTTITVNPLPTVGISTTPSSSVCFGSPVTLSGTGNAISYSWSGGITNGVPFIPFSTNTYTLTGTSAAGCTATDTISITARPLPVVGATASPASSICEGSPVTLNGTGATSYSWSGGVTNGLMFTPSTTATYTVTGTSSGCTATETITITVNSIPSVGYTYSPSTTICSGSSITLNGTGASSYSWTGGVTNGVAFTPPSTNTYTVTGTTAGCTGTAAVSVTVNPSPSVTAGASPSVMCLGSSVVFTGSGATSYIWSSGVINGVPFVPLTTDTYTVTGTGANGCTATDTITVTITSSPTVLLQPADQVHYEGEDALFITSSIPGVYFQWQADTGSGFNNISNGGQYSGATDDTLKISNVTLSQNGYKYRCLIFAGNCTDTTTTALLTVNSNIAVKERVNLNEITVYPNPASETLNLTFQSVKTETYIVRLMDINGRMILVSEERIPQGKSLMQLNLKNLAKGVYVLSVIGRDVNRSIRVIVE